MAVGWSVRSLIQTADSLESADRMVTHACDVHDEAFSPQEGIPWEPMHCCRYASERHGER